MIKSLAFLVLSPFAFQAIAHDDYRDSSLDRLGRLIKEQEDQRERNLERMREAQRTMQLNDIQDRLESIDRRNGVIRRNSNQNLNAQMLEMLNR